MRLCITGAPKTGKTTYAQRFPSVRHTDDVISLGWGNDSAEVATWLDAPGPWTIEGVAVARALRKWMEAHDGKPCDKVIYLDTPRAPQTPQQEAMGKGVLTVMSEILPELYRRGVVLEVK